jgi:hypothetical protein
MAHGKKTGGRTPGTPNKLTGEMREALGAVLGGEIDQLPKFLAKLEPKDRLDVVVKLLEFALPRLKGIEATIETEQDKSRIDLGLLTREERQAWYSLYNKACGSNGLAEDVELSIN